MLIASGLTLMCLGFVGIALAHAVWWPVIAGGILFGTGYSLVYPLLSAWMSEGLEPSRRAGPQALLNTSFNLATLCDAIPRNDLDFALQLRRNPIRSCGFRLRDGPVSDRALTGPLAGEHRVNRHFSPCSKLVIECVL